MKPEIVMLVETSLDGGLHGSRWSDSPDGTRKDWATAYEALHDELAGDAWIVGRVTMAEMSKANAHSSASFPTPARPVHVAPRGEGEDRPLAVALDPSGKLHFAGPAVNGDPVVVLLGPDVEDAHLAELAADGVSYVVAGANPPDLSALVATLAQSFGVRRLIVEGGAGLYGSFLAAGLVDDVHVLVAPAFDGAPDAQSIIRVDGGLKSKVELSLQAAEVTTGGMVHLRYTAKPGHG